MLLDKIPTILEKDGKTIKVNHTVILRQRLEQGWVEVGEAAKPAAAPKPMPEVAVEAGGDAFDLEAKVEEPSESLDEMTKAELLDWALEQGHDLKNALPKSQILKVCKEIEAEG